MKQGFIHVGIFNTECPYAIKDDYEIKNGSININDISAFCQEQGLDELHIYGPKSFTKGIKMDTLSSFSKNFKKCAIILEEDE